MHLFFPFTFHAFQPVELTYGQGFRFNGNECRHYTLPNATDSTRVSIDLRVVPMHLWTNAHEGKIGDYGTIIIGVNGATDDDIDCATLDGASLTGAVDIIDTELDDGDGDGANKDDVDSANVRDNDSSINMIVVL
jgi:hypothetical protein